MPTRRKNKTGAKGLKKQVRKQQSKPGVGKQILDVAAQMAMKALPMLLTSIPFPTSGARAIASPQNPFDMQVSAPAANGAVVRTSKASITNNPRGITVRHREYITDVVHGTPNIFEILEFEDVSPTNPQLFPWLSEIARRFETYKFEMCDFIYEPQTSTTSLGTVMMAVDYDALDEPPADKTDLMSYKGAVRSPAWFACKCVSAKSDLQKQKNYYTGNSSTGPGDLRLNSTGKFILAMQSESEAYTAGELYVEYIVRLETPQLQENGQAQTIQFPGNNYSAAAEQFYPGTETYLGNPIAEVFALAPEVAGLSFQQAGLYLLTTTNVSPPLATGPNTNSIENDFSVPTGSEVTLVTVSITEIVQQTVTQSNPQFISTYLVYVPNPNESIALNMSVSGTYTFTDIFSTLWITPIERSSIPQQFQNQLPSGASSVSSNRAMRLLEKRRHAALVKQREDLKLKEFGFDVSHRRKEKLIPYDSDALREVSNLVNAPSHIRSVPSSPEQPRRVILKTATKQAKNH